MSHKTVRLGFVSLLDAAPLIAALEMGFFADEGLHVELERQIGWGNVRDKLVYGHLHASHALFGMPALSVLESSRYIQPLVSIMSMGTGGDAITLSKRLTDAGVHSAGALARRITPRSAQLPILGHVFGCSAHHYLLRDWLAGGGIDPDRDVSLMTLPPMQMTRQMSTGMVDGFCAGEPWNTLAESQGLGRIVATTTQIVPAHPDKVLATSRRWLDENHQASVALIRAMLRGCAYCDDKANRPAQAEMLARPQYLNMPAELLLMSLNFNRSHPHAAGSNEPIRSCAMTSTFPSATHVQWLLEQMIRWGHLAKEIDIKRAAALAVDTTAYREAASEFKLDCPANDWPVMRFNPKSNVKLTGELNVAKYSAQSH